MMGITIARALYALNSGNAKNKTSSSTPRHCSFIAMSNTKLPTFLAIILTWRNVWQHSILLFGLSDLNTQSIYILWSFCSYQNNNIWLHGPHITCNCLSCASHDWFTLHTGTSNGVVPTCCMLTCSPISIVQNSKVLIEAHSNFCRMGGVHTHPYKFNRWKQAEITTTTQILYTGVLQEITVQADCWQGKKELPPRSNSGCSNANF